MTSWSFLLVASLSALAACGSRTNLGVRSGVSGSGGSAGAAGNGGSGAGGAGAGGGTLPPPSSVVLATLTQAAAGNTFAAFASFSTTSTFSLDGCLSSWPSAGDCCCMRGLSLPDGAMPSAGTVELEAQRGGTALATLMPTTTAAYGSWELGVWGAVNIGVYSPVASLSWLPGEQLFVTATGADIAAFSGDLENPASFEGVTPAIGPGAFAVDRSHDLTVSWAPEGRANESVLFSVQQSTSSAVTSCFCHVPDAAGSVTVPASLLGLYGVKELMGTIRLERLITSVVRSGEASVALVGDVMEIADATFE